MAGNTQGCVVNTGTGRRSPDTTTYIASTYFQQAAALLRQGGFAEAEVYLREVIRLWPRHAGALNNLGTSVWQQGRIQEAEAFYRRALAEAPSDFGVLNNLGNALWEQSRPVEAVDFYRRALRLQPDASETRMNLGVALSDVGEFDEAITCLETSLRLRPDFPEALDNLGMTLARQGRWDEALGYYERALAIRPDFPEAHRNRSFLWLAHGDYERGWPEHEWRLRCRNHRGVPVRRPAWTGEDIEGRTILLHAEQGLGDVVHFIRYAAAVKRRGARVIAACPDSLMRLLACCPGVDLVQDWYAPVPECDVHAPLMSLPAILGTTLATVPGECPYFDPDPAIVGRWRPVIERSLAAAFPGGEGRDDHGRRPFRIGIVWQGNPAHRNDGRRSFPLSLFAHLARVPDVRLISLQKGQGIEQLDGLQGRFPVAVFPGCGPGDQDRRDFLDTAAVMAQLDLVISPDSSAAHLAGSLGVRTWVPLTAVSDWRWLMNRDDSPWYPSVRLFRQEPGEDWEAVFRRMADRLRDDLAART
jgi:Tfp pilus assembly protein PilF